MKKTLLVLSLALLSTSVFAQVSPQTTDSPKLQINRQANEEARKAEHEKMKAERQANQETRKAEHEKMKAERQASHEARVEQRKENVATKIDAVNTRHTTIEQHLSNNEARAAKLNARQDKLLNK